MDKVNGKKKSPEQGGGELWICVRYVTVWAKVDFMETTKRDASVGGKSLKKPPRIATTWEASGDTQTSRQGTARFKPGTTGAVAARSGPTDPMTGAEVLLAAPGTV